MNLDLVYLCPCLPRRSAVQYTCVGVCCKGYWCGQEDFFVGSLELTNSHFLVCLCVWQPACRNQPATAVAQRKGVFRRDYERMRSRPFLTCVYHRFFSRSTLVHETGRLTEETVSWPSLAARGTPPEKGLKQRLISIRPAFVYPLACALQAER